MSGERRNITDLREKCFDTIDLLNAGKIGVNEARAVAQVAQSMVNSARAEIEYLRLTGQTEGSGFIPTSHQLPKPEK